MTYLPSHQPDDSVDATAANKAATPVKKQRKVTPKPARTSDGAHLAPAGTPSESDVVAYIETVEVEDGLTLSDSEAVASQRVSTGSVVEREMPSVFAFAPLPVFGMAALLALTSLTLTGCNESVAQTPPAAPVVTIAAAEVKKITEWDEFTGRTEAVEAVDVRPRIAGNITEVKFKAGQLVKKGDPLFVIDPRTYKAIVDQRVADVERAKVRLANAERMAKRATKLLDGKVISTEAEDTLVSLAAEAKSALFSAEAQLDAAQLDLEFTTVRSPIDGRISRALLTVGNYVSTTAKAGEPSLLTTIVSVDPIYVHVDVDELTLLKLKELGTTRDAESQKVKINGADPDDKIPVELAVGGSDVYTYQGYIESIDNRLDKNTSTILLRAVVPNSDGKLVPGLFTRVRIPVTNQKDTVLVAETAIGTDQAQKFVYTVDAQNKVAYRGVTLGPVIKGQRIVRSGLKPGEKVVVNGLQRARPGIEVNPTLQATQTAQVTDSKPKTSGE
ncbi:MAG: efflux RND transporter periplasmic adaptor subunit [Candidatus Methylacidiphilales bacterium]